MEQKVVQPSILQKTLEEFNQLDEKISHYSSILGLVDWDQKVMAPKKGRYVFAKATGTLRTEIFRLSVSKEMGQLLETFTVKEHHSQLDQVTRAKVREYNEYYQRSQAIPADLFREYSILTAQANDAWEEARENNDF